MADEVKGETKPPQVKHKDDLKFAAMTKEAVAAQMKTDLAKVMREEAEGFSSASRGNPTLSVTLCFGDVATCDSSCVHCHVRPYVGLLRPGGYVVGEIAHDPCGGWWFINTGFDERGSG